MDTRTQSKEFFYIKRMRVVGGTLVDSFAKNALIKRGALQLIRLLIKG